MALPRASPVARLGTQSFAPHQSVNPVLAATLAHVPQVVGDLAIAVYPAAFQPELLYQAGETLIFLLPGRHWC